MSSDHTRLVDKFIDEIGDALIPYDKHWKVSIQAMPNQIPIDDTETLILSIQRYGKADLVKAFAIMTILGIVPAPKDRKPSSRFSVLVNYTPEHDEMRLELQIYSHERKKEVSMHKAQSDIERSLEKYVVATADAYLQAICRLWGVVRIYDLDVNPDQQCGGKKKMIRNPIITPIGKNLALLFNGRSI